MVTVYHIYTVLSCTTVLKYRSTTVNEHSCQFGPGSVLRLSCLDYEADV